MSAALNFCVICYDNIQPLPVCEEEKEEKLNCSHIFHRECIGEWLKRKHQCPVCRAHVDVDTPELPRPEMTIEEILAVGDSPLALQALRAEVGNAIREIRRIRQLNLNENTPVANTAAKMNSLVANIFRW